MHEEDRLTPLFLSFYISMIVINLLIFQYKMLIFYWILTFVIFFFFFVKFILITSYLHLYKSKRKCKNHLIQYIKEKLKVYRLTFSIFVKIGVGLF